MTNFNQNGRPPRTLDLNQPGVVEWLTTPGITRRLRQLATTNPDIYNAFSVDLLQHHRAMSHSRAVPGQWMGDDRMATEPRPFHPRETYRPDREPGSKAHDVWRRSVEQVDAEFTTSALKQRMRSHDSDSPDSTWNRLGGSASSSPGTATADREPSLRESIEGAASLDYKE